ncbi:DUF4258 domain-containing protein [Candidatus Woesearchaeota archaeon]|nr:DUF4258 domain-containing protein [Candidatus Woesearchaeota archaeon]
MRFIYSKHAEKRLKERNILKIWVEETIKYPDLISRKKNKYCVVKKLNGKTLKVVYLKEKYIKVISCFFIV